MTASLIHVALVVAAGVWGKTRRGPVWDRFDPKPHPDPFRAPGGGFRACSSRLISAHVERRTPPDPPPARAAGPRSGPAGARQPRPAQRDVGGHDAVVERRHRHTRE